MGDALMRKTRTTSRVPSIKSVRPTEPPIKRFRAYSWSEYEGPRAYIEWLLTEIGRLGFELEDIESHDRAPHTRCVLSDLLEWHDSLPNEAMANLFDWKRYDLRRILDRWKGGGDPRPKIELTATINKAKNLTVRWYPAGWYHSWLRVPTPGGAGVTSRLDSREFEQPTDFTWFMGDEEASFAGRSSNELMYLRGVGNLRPAPRSEYGQYATHNRDVVDATLICAVRAAYERLIKSLKQSFDIVVIDRFEFELRDEEPLEDGFRTPTRRVVNWRIEHTPPPSPVKAPT